MHRLLALTLLAYIFLAFVSSPLVIPASSDNDDYEDFISKPTLVWFSREKIIFREDFEEYAESLKFPSHWSIISEGRGAPHQVLVDSPAIGSRSLQIWGDYNRKAIVSCNFTSTSSPKIVGAYILDLLVYVDLDEWGRYSFFDVVLRTNRGSITINASRLVRIENEAGLGRLFNGWNRFILVYNPWSGEIIYYVNIYTGHINTSLKGARPTGLWIGTNSRVYVDNIVLKEAYYTWLSSEWSTPPHGGVEYYSIAWSPRGDMLVYGASNGRVSLYSRKNGLLWEKKVNGSVTAIAWGSYGDRITVGTSYGLLVAFLPSGYTRWYRVLSGSIRGIAWSPSGLYAAVVTSHPNKLVVVDSNGTIMLDYYLPYTPTQVSWARGASGDIVVVGFSDGVVRAYGVKLAYGNSSQIILLWEKKLNANIIGLDYYSNTSSIIVALGNGRVLSINPVNASMKTLLDLNKPLRSLDCSPRGWITVVVGDREITTYSLGGEKLWDTSFNTSILPLGGVIHRIAWSPENTLLAVAMYARIIVYRLEGLFPWYTIINDTVENNTIGLDAHNTLTYNTIVKEYYWNFTGPGYMTSKAYTNYYLNQTGIFFIDLTVKAETPDNKTVFSTIHREIYVRKPLPPVPIVEYSPVKPHVNETIVFNATRSYDPDDWITKYIWSFGDGTTITGDKSIVQHKYSRPGSYTVKLTLIDKIGNQNTTTITIIVLPITPPPTTTTTQTETTTTQPAKPTTTQTTTTTTTTSQTTPTKTTTTPTSPTPTRSTTTTTIVGPTTPPSTQPTPTTPSTPSTPTTRSQIWSEDYSLLIGLVVVGGAFLTAALLLSKKKQGKPREPAGTGRKLELQKPPPPPPRSLVERGSRGSGEASVGGGIGTSLLVPGYILLEEIGRGGFSVVYKARRTSDNLIVALKIPKILLDETLSENILDSFLREAEVWSKLRHKYIVMVYDYGLEPIPYIAVEYMDAGSLRKKLLRKGKLSLKEAIDTALMIGEALSYAHHNGVVHRDIKPENVLYNKLGEAKLTDFGIAKILLEASTHTSNQVFKGTLLYAAPEQLDPQTYGESDWRTDIWQYGALLYEMLTGKPPFQADNPATLISMILYKQPPPPSTYNPQIPREIDEIVMKCLAKRKQERWKTIELILERLEEIREKQNQ